MAKALIAPLLEMAYFEPSESTLTFSMASLIPDLHTMLLFTQMDVSKGTIRSDWVCRT